MNCSVPIDVVVKGWNDIEVIFDAPKNAVLVGTTAGFQLLAVLKFPEPQLSSQVASCACADVAASNAAAATVLNKCVRPRSRKPGRDWYASRSRTIALCPQTAHMPQKAVVNWAAYQPLVEICRV